MLSVAAGVTFYALLALFPGITAFVSLYGLFADAGTMSDHLAKLSGILPSGALDIIGEQVRRIASKPAGSLGFAFFSGLAISLWSSNAGMKALFDALNIVYDEDEKRGFIKLNAISLLFTFGALVFLLLALGAVVAIPVVLKLFWFGNVIETLLSILRWPILLIGVLFGLACLYRYGPSRDKAQWRWVTWGSAIAAGLVARRLDAVLLVRGELRQLRRDLRLARRRHRLHDLDLAVDHRHSSRRRDQRGAGASDRGGHDRRGAPAARHARRQDGGHGRRRRLRRARQAPVRRP